MGLGVRVGVVVRVGVAVGVRIRFGVRVGVRLRVRFGVGVRITRTSSIAESHFNLSARLCTVGFF